MKKLKEIALEGASYLLICTFLYGLGKNVLENGKLERTRREVALSIDHDRNRLYTDNEWSEVYHSLGLNNTRKQGADLTINELKSYLDKDKRLTY